VYEDEAPPEVAAVCPVVTEITTEMLATLKGE